MRDSPDDDLDDLDDLSDWLESERLDCDHEDYEADILTGRATCGRCGYHWYQTAEEIAKERDQQRRYDEYIAELESAAPRRGSGE